MARRDAGYLAAIAGVAGVSAALAPFQPHLSPTTVALALLLVVLFVATGWGSRPALVSAILGVLCLNLFFLPPLHTLTVAAPENYIALLVFLITGLTAGELSARARRRAEEAEAGRREIERLYRELQAAFARESSAEARRQSEQLKSALLDAVTHDLRTPLTSIKASVTTLLGEANEEPSTLDPEGRRELLEVIDEETDRLNRDIENLIELARIEAGEMRWRRRWIAVDDLIATALERAHPLLRSHRLEVALEAELPAIRVDAGAIAEVIYILIDNATKYAPPRTRLLVSAARAAGESIEIAVEDEGGGVPAEMRERIFDKFFRATRDHAAGRPAGIGLGLAVARGIIEAHGGEIAVESGGRGRGSRFFFRVPVGDEGEEHARDV
jgi:two-component system sensor histidine kinase KdpD